MIVLIFAGAVDRRASSGGGPQLFDQLGEARAYGPPARHHEVLDLQVHAHPRLAALAQVGAETEAAQSQRGGEADLRRRPGIDLLPVEVRRKQHAAAYRLGVSRPDLERELALSARRPRLRNLLRGGERPGIDGRDDRTQRRQVDLLVVIRARLAEAERACYVTTRKRLRSDH